MLFHLFIIVNARYDKDEQVKLAMEGYDNDERDR
ncbi:hypothetical protein SAMN05444126_12525 [Salisediminibacterium halotolerans]|uniref:Uncharacterized protein n=1 Tax=Salisediminibacterium halotolerans TaxID=517425 RepID=A0A1H9VZH8_9BACI|nr:hypothetical protein SAMN05444126_12525 [Salisediminibacterium haloalkalitolerans]